MANRGLALFLVKKSIALCLPQLNGLLELGVELRARRLLWLRSALVAENGGELRLDLAALFGKLRRQAESRACRPQWQAQQLRTSIVAPAG